MESLSYYLEARGPVLSEDIEFPVDLLARNRNLVKDWDTRVLSDFYKNMPSFDRETVESMEFMETNFPSRMGKLLSGNPGLGGSSDKMTDNSNSTKPSATMANFDSFMYEAFSSKFCAITAEPHSERDSTVDPKLENWTDSREADILHNSEKHLVASSMEQSSPAKRARITNLHSQIPICQVHGCYKDLSSSKDYHKRHRVCDVHSKTAKVVINGIEKRFCQQCSRFHLLTEFDDGKRSCRKRLAGHNERRRKPQLGAHLGSEFLEMTLLKRTPFFSPETFPTGFLYQEKFENDNHSRHFKLVHVPPDNSALADPKAKRQASKKSIVDHHIKPSRTTCVDTAVAVKLSVLPDSNDALSLLSTQSQNSSSNSAGVSMALPPAVYGVSHHSYIEIDQNSAKNLRSSSFKVVSRNGYSSGGINQEGIAKANDDSMDGPFEVQREGTSQVLDYRQQDFSLSHEFGTVNLLQLSSHLQRVEQQRNSFQVKQENKILCCSSNV